MRVAQIYSHTAMKHGWIGAEVILPYVAGNRRMARVLHQVRESESSDDHPTTNVFNDQSVFEVQFPDGDVDRLAAKCYNGKLVFSSQ